MHPIDLLDLEDEDVASLGMRKLELKRWAQAMEDLKAADKNRAPPPAVHAAGPSPPVSPPASRAGAAGGQTGSAVAGGGDDSAPPSPPNQKGLTVVGCFCPVRMLFFFSCRAKYIQDTFFKIMPLFACPN